jgi:hypothetical protein
MYFISEEKDLVGKEIIFTHMAQFAEAVTIVTKDKGILVVENDGEGNEIYHEHNAKKYVVGHNWLRKELHKRGIISLEDIERYEEEERLKAEQRQVAFNQMREKQERDTYERLKAKFEK